MPLRSPGTTVARTDAEIVEAVEDSAVALAAGSTVGGTAIASTDDVRTDAEIVAAVEASATLDLDAGATIGGSGIVSDADLALVALDDLADVSAGSPSDQDVLTWDDGTSTWVAQAAGGGVSGDVATSIELTRTTATSTGTNSICIGNGASAIDHGDIAIGYLAHADGTGNFRDAVAIGREAEAKDRQEVSVGAFSGAPRTNAVGRFATSIGGGAGFVNAVSGQQCGRESVAVGYEAERQERAYYGTVLGAYSDAYAKGAVAVGLNAEAHRQASAHLRPSDTNVGYGKNATVNSYRFRDLHHVVEMRASTTNATPTEATADQGAVVATDTHDRNVVVLADGKVAGFILNMTAIQGTTNDAACYEIVGAAKCIGGTASIIGTNTTVAKEDDATWDCTVTCTSNRLVVTCTADAGGTTTWRGILTLTYDG
jgi:hypothetical protein